MLDEQLLRKRVITNSVDVFVTLALISLFVYFSLRILSPFISILLWAGIMAVALYPVFVALRDRIGGRASLAATIMVLIGLCLLFGPAWLIVQSILDTVGPLASQLKGDEFSVPPPNEAVKDWPLIGNWLYKTWAQASINLQQTAAHFAPQLANVATFLLKAGGGLAGGVLQFALSIAVAGVLLRYAEPLTNGCNTLANRVASERGRALVQMAGATVRNVSRGVLGVAIIQGGLASVGIFAIGMPFAGFVSALCIAGSIVQVPFLVIVPAIIYVWAVEPTVPALLFTVYMIPVLLSDNVLKPILMARGLETPMIVIFIGVIGGTILSGLLGLFIGPVVLAVFYKMIIVWVSSIEELPETVPDGADIGDPQESANESES